MQDPNAGMVEPAQINLLQAQLTAQQQLKGGASWFLWIAGLSLLNSLILLFGGTWNFVIGLGMTQIVDGFFEAVATSLAPEIGGVIRIIGFVVDISIAGLFVLFGVLAKKGYGWSFIVGMVLYALDGCIFVLVQSWLGVGFHLFALVGLYGGYKALKKSTILGQPGAIPTGDVASLYTQPQIITQQRSPRYWRNLALLAGILLLPVVVFTVVLLLYLP
jgi:hypothetical protein